MKIGGLCILFLMASSAYAKSNDREADLEQVPTLQKLALFYVRNDSVADALPLLQRVLNIRIQGLGFDHEDTIKSMLLLASIYDNQGRHAIALTCMELVYVIRFASLGEVHPDTIQILNSLIERYEAAGEFELAFSLTIGENRPDLIATLKAVASLHAKAGEFSMALPFAERALNQQLNTLGEAHPDTLTSQNNVAALYANLDHYDKAVSLLTKSLNALRKTQGNQDVKTLRALTNMATIYFNQQRYLEALPLYKELYQTKLEIHGKQDQRTINSLFDLASIHNHLGNLKRADELFEIASRTSSTAFNLNERLKIQNNKGLLYQQQGSYKKAISAFQQVVDLTTQIKGEQHPETLTQRVNLANLYDAMGDYQKANLHLQELYQLLTESQGELHEDTLFAGFSLGKTLINLYQYDQAEIILSNVLESQRESIGDKHPLTLSTQVNLAVLYRITTQYSIAEQLLQDALLKRAESLGEYHPDTLYTQFHLAVLSSRQGFYAESERLFQLTLSQLEDKDNGGNHPHYLNVLSGLADLYRLQGRFDEAEKYYLQALTIQAKTLGVSHPDTLSSESSLVSLYLQQGSVDKAKIMGKATLDKRRQTLGDDHPLTLESLDSIARIMIAKKEYSDAELVMKDLLNKRNQLLGKYHPHTISSLNENAFLYEYTGKMKQAAATFIEAWTRSKESLGSSHPDTLAINSNIATHYQAQKQPELAFKYWKNYLRESNEFLLNNLWSAPSRTRNIYLEKEASARDSLLSFYLELNTPLAAEEALYMSASRKGMIMRVAAQINSVSQASADPIIKNILQEIANNKATLSQLMGQLTNEESLLKVEVLKAQLEALEADLATRLKPLNRLDEQLAPSAIIKGLATDQVLIDFQVFTQRQFNAYTNDNGEAGVSKTMAIVTNPSNQTRVQLIDLGDSKEIEQLVMELRLAVSEQQSNKSITQASKALYNRLWKPILPLLGNKKKVVISPDGVLNLLPFSLLETNEGTRLIDSYSLGIVGNPQDILQTKALRKKRNATIFSAPLYEPEQKSQYLGNSESERSSTIGVQVADLHFSALPGTLKEGKAISGLLDKNGVQSSLYFLEQATEERLKSLDKPQILHLASHGYFLNSANSISQSTSRGISVMPTESNSLVFTESKLDFNALMTRSGLALTNANIRPSSDDKEDGILTAMEASGLNLDDTDLVVLSACDTGVGEIRIGEGVYSLQRAFKEAGAKSVLYTLWPVSDEGTQLFMQSFYKNYLVIGNAQEALIKTQQTFSKGDVWNSPLYWAGFIVSGI